MMLAMFAGENRDDWDDLLLAVMMAYRSSVHELTGYSPYRLMFGEECTLPMDVGLPRQDPDLPDPITSPYAVWVRDALEVAYDQVCRHSGQAVRQQKRLYDWRAVRGLFAVGDWALRYYSPAKKCKLDSAWVGPYLVVSLAGWAVGIQLQPDSPIILVHCHAPVAWSHGLMLRINPWGHQVAVMFQIVSALALEVPAFLLNIGNVRGMSPDVQLSCEPWGHADHSGGGCGCLSSDRMGAYVHGLSLMPRESLTVPELEDVSVSTLGSGARMNHMSGIGARRPGSVPFVSQRPGAYGRLLLAVYVWWKTGLLVASDWPTSHSER